MSDATPEPARPGGLRRAVLIAAAAAALFWLYTFFHIARVANPKGDGMEWLAAVPMTVIFAVLVLPPGIVALFARSPLVLKIAAAVLALGVVADAVVWSQIFGEFAGKSR